MWESLPAEYYSGQKIAIISDKHRPEIKYNAF